MVKFLGSIFSSATFRQSSSTFLGTGINGFLGALFYIILARFLGPSDFGLLSVAVAVLTLISDIANLGTDTGLVKFVSNAYARGDQVKAYKFLKLSLDIRVISSVVIFIIGWILAPVIAGLIFQKSELLTPLRLAFIGVLGVQLFSFSISAFQAFEKFFMWSVIQILMNAIRLVIIIVLFYSLVLNLSTTLITYIAIPFFGFFFSLLILPKGFLFSKHEFSVSKDFFHYTKWVTLFTILAALSSRLDTFISARLLPSYQVGFYAAANQMTAVIPQLVGALSTVVAPKMSSMVAKTDFVEYFKKTQLFVLGLAFIILLLSPIGLLLIPTLFGLAYAASVPILFFVLLLAMLIFLISVPIHSAVFYYYSFPQLFVYISLGHLLIIAIAGWFLISWYGVLGAAITVLLGTIFNFIVPLAWVIKKLK